MQLKSIRPDRDDWGANKGMLTGSVTVQGQTGEITIRIDPAKAHQVVSLLADALVATTQETAQMMAAQIIEQASTGKQLGYVED